MIHIIHGQDLFRSRLFLKEFQKQQKEDNRIVEKYNSEDIEISFIDNFIKGSSLFSEFKILIIEDAFSKPEIIELVENSIDLINTHPHHSFAFYETQDLESNKNFKSIGERSEVSVFNELSRSENIAFLREYFKKHIGISDAIVTDVYNRCNQDMRLSFNELNKISTFCVDRVATAEDADTLSVGVADSNIFLTIDSIFSKNPSLAFDRLQDNWASGDSPEGVFAMLERQLKIISLIKDQIDNGETSSQTIARKINLHPYVVQKTFKIANNISWNTIKKLYQRIESLDARMKQGNIDPYFACELFSFAAVSM